MTSPAAGIEGALDDLGLADLLGLLERTGRAGVLHIEGDQHAVVVIGPGTVHLATTDTGPGLRRAVIGAGLADEATWQEAVARTGPGAAPGAGLDALVERGVDRGRLRAVIYEHSVSTLFELLLPSRDDFRFVPGEQHPFAVEPGYPLAECLDDARRRLERWRDIAATIPSTATVLRRTATLPVGVASVTIAPMEWEVLGLLDGHRDVATLVHVTGMGALALSALLHRLVTDGLAEVLTP
ncbi:MAG TPA: DUF4388 domain-containing protein [Acidimicrobiales bacterium]|nr:DUF4388 domain-containing protein [Acidimicrobiales bacterium]